MAKMIRLDPALSEVLPCEGWEVVATEAGRYADGLRATLLAYHDGTLPVCRQVPMAQPGTKKWREFVEPVAQASGCGAPAVEAVIRKLYEAIEGRLRPKPKPNAADHTPTGERREIQVNARFDREIIADAVEVLVRTNDPPTLFMRGGAFVHVAAGALEAALVDVPRLRGLVDELSDCITIVDTEGGQVVRPSRLPFTVCQDLLVKPLAQAFPPLSGIRTAPVFLAGGGILDKEGYDPASGYLLRLGALPVIRTDMPVRDALTWLQHELLADFPLMGRHSHAHALALLLEPFVKPLIGGKTPAYLIDAATRGSGKGLLADVACLIATAGTAHIMPLTGDEPEHEKRITALLMSGASWILLDNVNKLDSSSLSAALTARIWRGRILGVSRMISVPNDATWVATGNNVRLSSEMARRVVPIRLEPEEERPEERMQFKHAPLAEWVLAHRAELISACVSLIRAWIAAGQRPGAKTLGSFERWAAVMGGILAHAGIDGFLEGRDALHTESDQQTEDWKALFEHWWKAHEALPVTAKDVLALAKHNDLLLGVWAGRKEIAAQQRLGHALHGMRGRVLGSYCLRPAGRDSATKSQAYRLEPKETSPLKNIGLSGNHKTPETPELPINTEDLQTTPPQQNHRNPPVETGVLWNSPGSCMKTHGASGPENPDSSKAFGVSGVLGGFDWAPTNNTATQESPRRPAPPCEHGLRGLLREGTRFICGLCLGMPVERVEQLRKGA
jgi:hypothetical protein